MSVRKVSVTLPTDLLEEAMTYAPNGNLSAYIADGLRRRVLADRLARYLDELDRESGVLTPDEIEAARLEWLSEP